MNRSLKHSLVIASLAYGLSVTAPARAASLVQVNRSEWTGGVNLPSYVQMYIYVPDQLAEKPPIMVSSHSCGSTATGQMGNIPLSKAAADSNGFILILPDNPGQNCWDVGTNQSLSHDGGGDTHAVAQMVRYALEEYNGDPERVYAMGGSSGGMMTQALMAVYPDLFRAGSARAGVPAGCWADGYASSNQWSNNCAGGNTTKSAEQWGDLVRGMYPNYTGHRPRVQIIQGENDTTISYRNTAESIKEWTNVLELGTDPTSTDMGYRAANATYNRQFWENACGYVVFEAWSSPGGTHSMPYEEADILKFFGLDVAGGADPEPACPTDGSAGGTGGMGGAGGASTGGMSGAAGVSGGGMTGTGGVGPGAGAGPVAGTGGMPGGAGTSGAGGAAAGMPPVAGMAGVPGSSGAGTTGGSAGTAVTGGRSGSGGSAMGMTGGTGGASGDDSDENPPADAGCGCTTGEAKSRPVYALGVLFGLALLAVRRRRRGTRAEALSPDSS
jgi:poly(hydroxyalkanoate) depolymerase family esterase